MKLSRHYVEKPWGRTRLPAMFDPPPGERIGEVWFGERTDLPLLAKYIFTSERLSIQVHPDDEQARVRGLPSGKTECWYILDAEPGSTIGLGLKAEVSAEDLRDAALDGSIEHLVAWRAVRAGDFYLVPPGTIHAIGGGLSLIEFQQNADITYRLYDYGRPRALALEDGTAVARRGPYHGHLAQHLSSDEERLLVAGSPFELVLSRKDEFSDRQRWVLPMDGEVRSGRVVALAGDCLLAEPGEIVESHGARMLIGTKA